MPGVKTAASHCGIHFLHLPELLSTSNEQHPNLNEVPGVEEQNDPSFIGGPRPTMTKLMVLKLFLIKIFFKKPCDNVAEHSTLTCNHLLILFVL